MERCWILRRALVTLMYGGRRKIQHLSIGWKPRHPQGPQPAGAPTTGTSGIVSERPGTQAGAAMAGQRRRGSGGRG